VSLFRIISAEKARFPVSLLCDVLDVNRSSFYAWETRAPSDRALSDAWLTEQIKEIWAAKRKVYGARRIHAELRLARGINVSRKRVERLMREAGISGLIRRRRKGTTVRVPGVRVADDLVQRGFRPAAPNVLWCADITYLETWQGRCYLAAVQDLFSRAIVGWQLADHMRAELVVDALQMAVHRRRPRAGLVHHSDQGGQYVSLAFGQAARDAGIAVSMGSRGDCFDNAVAESFFSTLKKELIRREGPFATRADLRLALFDYIEAFYNRTRRHSTLGYLSPEEFERETTSETIND
jgi:putative transposase